MDAKTIWLYIVVMAGVTYLIRMLPLALLRKKLRSRFIKSFLFYVLRRAGRNDGARHL